MGKMISRTDPVIGIVRVLGSTSQELSYDAWGRLRDPSTHALYNPANEPELIFGRGYCGHEHLTGLGLINMNARLYDPLLGRFLSSDPHIATPFMSQAYNRYSYGLNNPIAIIDRNGEFPILVALGVIVGGYLGGVIANNGSKQKWNPFKWNYNNVWTYVGIIGGGFLGGYAGNAIALGKLGVSIGAVSPFASIGLNYSKDKSGKPSTDIAINTPMGGHWNSGEEKASQNAENSYNRAVESMRYYYNSITSNLSTNSSAIRYHGPRELIPYATKLSNTSTYMYYYGQVLPITINSINSRYVSPEDQRKIFEMAGGYVGSWVGGRTMGISMASLYSETGLGTIVAGGYGYIVGSYMGYQMGSNLGDSFFNIWYDLYYNTYSSLKEIENYSNSIQNYYQPIW